jgi:uncharacterized damage-inducible protein DinB
MSVDQVREWFAYHRWAHRETLARVERLAPADFTRDLGSSFPSVRDTLVHLLSAEWLWAERWRGESPRRRLDPADFPDLAAIRRRWAVVERAQDAYLAGLTDEALGRPFAYVNPEGERWEYLLWQVLLQLVTHACYHRGQVTTMLRQLGAEPAGTDVLTYYDHGAPRLPAAG